MAEALKRLVTATAAAAAVVALASGAASALDKVRVGKAVPTSFAFSTLEVGVDARIWESVGLELEISAFRGDAQLQQGMAAGSTDFGLGSGPGMGYRSKGVPAIAVASLADRPQNMALLVAKDSKIKTVADLKGKRVGVTTAGSLTDWLVRELSRQQGWGSEGIEAIPMGQMRARLAAMATGELAGTVQTTANGYELEEQGEAKVLMVFGDLVKDFHTHIIFARDELVAKQPSLVERFLMGWFKTVAYMKANKDFTVKSVAKTMQLSEGVIAKTYAAEMQMMSDDGRFNPAAIEVIRHSLKELGIMDTVPDAKSMYIERFIPVKF
ncbi:MAG: ABC transporter substrate-binding protein [Proteobacteria bacterium]|nr:ABC transporter substrate-binding protein [Pseudomonadota bacterium]